MENFKNILIFLGLSLGPYVRNIGIHIGLLLLSLLMVFALFFLSFHLFDTIYMFLITAAVYFVFIHQCRKRFLLKRQCQMNARYWDFLDTGEVNGDGKKYDWNVILPQTYGQLKKKGMVLYIKKVVAALSAAVARRMQVGRFIRGNHRVIRDIIIRNNLMEAVFFILLLVPFTGISFFLTAGLPGSVQILIYVVGFMFVYFLHSGVFDPVFYLLVQQKMAEAFTADPAGPAG